MNRLQLILLVLSTATFSPFVFSETTLSPTKYEFYGQVIYAELSGDFPLGDSRQPIYKSLRPFDLVS